jgi:hypothetical protein
MKYAGGLLLLIPAAAGAQDPGDEPPPVIYPTIVNQAASIEAFVPMRWKLETQAGGDLNGDGLPDAALVLLMTDPNNLVPYSWDQNQKYDTNPRVLVVVFARKGGGYELAMANHRLIPRNENQNQDDPLDEIAIRNGVLRAKLRLFMSAGGWWMGNVGYTFRWQQGSFRMIGYDRDGVTRNTGETDRVSINYLTRTKLVEFGNIDGSTASSRRLRLPRKPLLTVDQVGDGLMFDPTEND